jgi:hypothetical protein
LDKTLLTIGAQGADLVAGKGAIRVREDGQNTQRETVCEAWFAGKARQKLKTLNELLNRWSMIYEFPSKPGLFPILVDCGRPVDDPPAARNLDLRSC